MDEDERIETIAAIDFIVNVKINKLAMNDYSKRPTTISRFITITYLS